MKHDLDAINAAIASGDWAVPPIGSIVMPPEWFQRHFPEGFSGVSVIEASSRWNGWVVMLSDCGCFGREIGVGLGEIVQIISLPNDAPPFSEWPRP